ncbi:MAG: hypothetical protein M3077_11635 [Candidatus Dormibacteraeota bacterium]|nr:hypothetical protein [Candidatus Dormibacteraeota bacterium]
MQQHHSIRACLGLTTAAAVAAGASLLVFATPVAFAADELTVTTGTSFTVAEGTQASNKVVANFTDNPPITRPVTPHPPELSCSQLAQARYTTSIDWGDGSTASGGNVSCTDGGFRVKGSHTYKDSGIFHINVTVTDTDDDVVGTGTNTATATVTDGAITGMTASNKTSVEGSGALKIDVEFTDAGGSFSSNTGPGLTAAIAWGDGTSSAGTVKGCECEGGGNVTVSGTHTYDANKPPSSTYTVTVTLSDDGGKSAVDTFTVKVADAALSGTGTPISATAGTTSSPVVATITDKAGDQAAAGDFAASIKWGDGATSPGTITKTASGTFRVSGTHKYSSAGARTVSVTITDEEGQTLTISAAAAVGAAPIVLPNTGQPKAPVTPSSPWLALALMLLALAGGIGGLIRLRANR